MKRLTTLAAAGALASAPSFAAEIVAPGTNPARVVTGENFTGHVVAEPILDANEHTGHNVTSVTFAPGARTVWHSHPRGQTLLVTQGVGWVQERGGERHEIRAGDTVFCPPGVDHWHGATEDSLMSHIALSYFEGEANVTWAEAVTDADYAAE